MPKGYAGRTYEVGVDAKVYVSAPSDDDLGKVMGAIQQAVRVALEAAGVEASVRMTVEDVR